MYAFGTSAPQASQPAAVVAAPAPRVSPAGVPVPPPKDIAGGERRGSARPISGRASGGGLSGQYSTSVPSGSYFPEHQPVPEDGEDHPGRRRQTEKERALKAAWGIDTRECSVCLPYIHRLTPPQPSRMRTLDGPRAKTRLTVGMTAQ